MTTPLDWLLEPEHPSLRYRALTEVLGLPAEHPQALAARAAIPGQALVQRLYDLQNDDGSWGPDPAKPYTAEGAVAALALLHMHAVIPDARSAAGCASFLTHSQNAVGGFSMTAARRSGIFPCTTGRHLGMLVYFGFERDSRLRRAFTFLIESMAGETSPADPGVPAPTAALTCGRYDHRACLWGGIAALQGLAALPADMVCAESQAAVRRLADALLDARYDFGGEHKRWLTLSTPRGFDLLAALSALHAHGYAGDARYAALFEHLRPLVDDHGRLTCGSTSRAWPLEPRGRPSKWLTLDLLRLEGRLHSAAP